MKNYLLMIALMTFGMNAWGVCYDSSSDSLNYKDCLADARELSALIRSRIEHFNQISQKSYVIEEFKESILQGGVVF